MNYKTVKQIPETGVAGGIVPSTTSGSVMVAGEIKKEKGMAIDGSIAIVFILTINVTVQIY